MERFKSIYPFTTENIAGYMKDLDLTDKKVITVIGSGDHILNLVLLGSKDITAFDVNPLAKIYTDLKIGAIKSLSYEEFINFLLFENNLNLNYEIILNLNMPKESKSFWLKQLNKFNKNGIMLRKSSLFNTKYFNPKSKLWQNLYLDKNNYNLLKEKLNKSNINFMNINLKDLRLNENYDYMFLSNISDYLNLMYSNNILENYRNLLCELQKRIEIIYFAYLYDVEGSNPRTLIDNLKKVKEVFLNIEQINFKSALEGYSEEKKDSVLILKRGGK